MAKKKQTIAAKKSAPQKSINTKQTTKHKAAAHVEAPAIEQETTDEAVDVIIDPVETEITPAPVAVENENQISEVINDTVEEAAAAAQANEVQEEVVVDTPAEQEPVVSTDEPVKKSRKSKLGNEITIKLVGCSYHYFRRFFKKRFAAENIKVRFVKQATGYNGHIEIAEATKTEALALLEQIKTDNPTVKNLWWELA